MKNYTAAAGLLAGLLIGTSAHALKVEKQRVILESLDDYELCQSRDYTGGWCHEAMGEWVKAHPADAFKAGKLTRLKMNHWAAIPFFHQAFAAKQGNCKDEDLKLAVVSALDLPNTPPNPVVAQAKHIGFERCFPELAEAIVAAAPLGSYAFTNVCQDLIAKGALSGLKKKKCEK